MVTIIASAGEVSRDNAILVDATTATNTAVVFARLVAPCVRLAHGDLPRKAASNVGSYATNIYAPPPTRQVGDAAGVVIELTRPVTGLDSDAAIAATVAVSNDVVDGLQL